MILSWFNAKAAQSVGIELARLFIVRVPAGKKLTERKFETKAKAALIEMAKRIAEYEKSSSLNAYQKAKLGNSFKWTLKDAGYDSDYVDKLTDLLMFQL